MKDLYPAPNLIPAAAAAAAEEVVNKHIRLTWSKTLFRVRLCSLRTPAVVGVVEERTNLPGSSSG